MAQVRICMSCGTAWDIGSMAALDGFCLSCPGELGPPVEADAPEGQTTMQTAAAAKTTMDSNLPPAVPLPLEADGRPDLPEVIPRPKASASTTAAVDVGDDDLEPRPPTRGSAALTKIHYSPEMKMPGGRIRAEAQAQAMPAEEVQVNIDPLTGHGTEVLERAASSRRHPAAGDGDTTAVIVTDANGIPVAPVVKQPAIARIAGITSGLPVKLARATWHCRDCHAVYPPGSDAVGTRRCSACSGKIEPEIAPVAADVASLVLYDPDTRVRIARFHLQSDVFLIGRLDPGGEIFPDLNLNDYIGPADARQVSRRQCEIQRDRSALPTAYFLAPLPANSGVYVKGNLIEPGQRLKLEDQTLFGIAGDRIYLRFEENRAT